MEENKRFLEENDILIISINGEDKKYVYEKGLLRGVV